MRLIDLLAPERVRIPLRAAARDEVLRELVGLALGPDATALEDVLALVEEREAELSTGIGCGVAVPHARTDAVSALRLAAGTVPAGLPYDALDGEPVRLLFLVLGPQGEADAHVRALSRIARLVRHADVRERLAGARDADAFLRSLREAEQ